MRNNHALFKFIVIVSLMTNKESYYYSYNQATEVVDLFETK